MGHPFIKIIKSQISQDDQKFSSKLATGISIKKSSINLTQKLQFLSTVYPLSWSNLHKKIIFEPLSQLVNETIVNEGFFLDAEKITCVTPAFKKEERLDWTNYRPISVLNVFSKVFERFILDQLTFYFKSILSDFRSAYRKQYSCQHVLLRMIETLTQATRKTSFKAAYSTRRPYNIKVPRVNQTTFGTRSIRYEGAKIWNHLPNSLKSAETLEILIKTWEGSNCKCNFCKHLVSE